jgi:23S rRNA pseudouridine1911/1915/1917 synthase
LPEAKKYKKIQEIENKNNSVKEIEVIEEGIRLDAYIASSVENLSRSMVQKLIKCGKVLVNNKVEKESYKVQLGDKILVEIPEPEESSLKKQNIPLDIIYEDNDILVVNKPKGMVVHPGNGNPDGTLANAILAHCEESLSGIGGEIRPGIVHRIDKDTSGLLVIAKNDKAHINLSEQIKNREVKKIYVALVKGVIPENEATINMPIGRSTKDRKKMAVDREGKEAVTHFKVLKRYNKYTFIQVKIDTGRTHQIRVHMSHIGYPVVGDTVYSNGKNDFGVEGQMLHAKELEFKHPITGENMHFEAPLPEYFEEVLEKLEQA